MGFFSICIMEFQNNSWMFLYATTFENTINGTNIYIIQNLETRSVISIRHCVALKIDLNIKKKKQIKCGRKIRKCTLYNSDKLWIAKAQAKCPILI